MTCIKKYWELSSIDGTDGESRNSVVIDVHDQYLEMFRQSNLGIIDKWIPLSAKFNYIGCEQDDFPIVVNPYVTSVVSNRLKKYIEDVVPNFCQFLKIRVSGGELYGLKDEMYWIMHCLFEVDIINLSDSQIEDGGHVWIPEPVVGASLSACCDIPIGRLKHMGWVIVVNDDLRKKIDSQNFIGVNFHGFRYSP